ncbi:hypothetical protein G6L97_27090 (plasmid) [Agrobacterium tumefaciens]|uniref:hypothetical protein n=1 Tax=Agrobacterium tumefaciens TaxID=358 RepID=UPI0015749E74|nr:hypothetical protein [Agrobacterium tumefaciens]WCA73032.1 hypothetical protein G6L97_27090 [Agrobacterium tumefaciens]
MQIFQSHVSFECPACHKRSSGHVEIPEPDWQAAESSSDLNSEGNIYVQCTECDEEFAAYVENNAGNVQIKLDDFPDTYVDADNAFYSREDWPEPEVPDDPRSIFADLHGEVSAWLGEHGSDYGGALINRMLFASLIGGLEAFLSDTLLNAVAERKEAQLRLVKQDKEVLAMKFSAAEVLENPNIVIETLTSHLRDISFHNLPRINALYRAGLEIDFFALVGKDAVAALNKAVALRHHVVHRNGRDKQANLLDDFTPGYVKSVLDLVDDLVRKIDEAVNPHPF